MENKENKKKGKVIAIAVAIVVVVCIAVAIFFVSSNNTKKNDNSDNNNISSSNNDNNNNVSKVSSISEEEIKKYIELDFRGYYSSETDRIVKIEKYEERGNERYIYIADTSRYNDRYKYAILESWFYVIDASSYPEEVKVAYKCTDTDVFYEWIEKFKQMSDEEFSWHTYDKSDISNNSSSNSNSSSSSYDYLDDLALKALAFKKWLDKDTYVSAQYDYSNCTYTGNVTKNSDGSVSVDLILYDKDTYDQCLQYRVPVSNAKLASTTIKLTKEEATK